MAANVLQAFQRLVQDVLAPDVRRLTVRLSAFEKSVDEQFASLERRNEARSQAILAAIGESRGQSELSNIRAY